MITVLEVVKRQHGVTEEELRQSSRGEARVAVARQCWMYILHCILGMSLADVSREVERDRGTVRHAVQTIEDLRDDLEVDLWLDYVEEMHRKGVMTC